MTISINCLFISKHDKDYAWCDKMSVLPSILILTVASMIREKHFTAQTLWYLYNISFNLQFSVEDFCKARSSGGVLNSCRSLLFPELVPLFSEPKYFSSILIFCIKELQNPNTCEE